MRGNIFYHLSRNISECSMLSLKNTTTIKDSQYSRSVCRNRNIGHATIKQYQLTIAIVVKSHSKACSACKLVYSVSKHSVST
jgi:hypothetical protein